MENTSHHLSVKTIVIRQYKCPVCGKVLRTRYGIIYHLLNHYKKDEITRKEIEQYFEKTKLIVGKKPKYVKPKQKEQKIEQKQEQKIEQKQRKLRGKKPKFLYVK